MVLVRCIPVWGFRWFWLGADVVIALSFDRGWFWAGVGVSLFLIGWRCRDSSELARPSVQSVPEVVQLIVRFLNFKDGGRGDKVG